MPRCDIIIPVYNAFDCLAPCIESILKYTDLKTNHLILIDDKSPDARVLPLLESYAKQHPDQITLLKNSENLGFVKTVNRGMQFSKHDVLLLNSDTEVTENWLAKIQTCAYSDSSIATVTPLSNCATLASVPRLFARNELPKDCSLSEMANLVESCSLKKYPSLPTAHGFCMFIKREALNKVGFFDEEAFGKGYGEENDFSFRCINFGYRNALCDDTYILHKESQSFLSDKKDNGAALAKKHPTLKSGLDFWIQHPDIKLIGNNVALALGLKDRYRPNLLIVIHDWSNINNNVGGTTLHVLDLIQNLRDQFNFHILFPENGVYKIHSYFKNVDLITSVYPKPVDIAPAGFFSKQYADMFTEILQDYQISLVHVHHIIGHYLSLGKVCLEQKIKYLVSLHDLYLSYPEVSKVDDRVRVSRSNDIDLDSWHRLCGEFLAHASNVIAPSEFAKNEYKKVYPKLKIDVIEHGVNVSKIVADHVLSNKTRNIAFVGAVFPHKGSAVLEDLVHRGSLPNTKIHLFGTTTAVLPNSRKFKNHGPYQRNELPELFKKHHIDLVCIFSLAPETFAYTVDEAIAAGLPVLTFNIGAGVERVKRHNLGWVLSYTNNINKISQKINGILSNPSAYAKVIDSINQYQTRTVSEMSADYSKIYSKIAQPTDLSLKDFQRRLERLDFIQSVSDNNNNDFYRAEYGKIVGSFRWRVVSKVRIPTTLTRPLRKVYHRIKK